MHLWGDYLKNLIKDLIKENKNIGGKLSSKMFKEPELKNDARAKKTRELIEEYCNNLENLIKEEV